jgi:hypothetical protein
MLLRPTRIGVSMRVKLLDALGMKVRYTHTEGADMSL